MRRRGASKQSSFRVYKFSNEAKAEWRRIVPRLEEAELLTTIDRGLLVRYCCAWADWARSGASSTDWAANSQVKSRSR